MSRDIRIEAENAVLGQPERGPEIIPGFDGTRHLARLIGKGRAKELTFTRDRIDAQEVYRIGFASRVVLSEELMTVCRQNSQQGHVRSQHGQEHNQCGMDMDLNSGLQMEADGFGFTCSTRDKQEDMTAFLEKRPSMFTDFSVEQVPFHHLCRTTVKQKQH